MTAGELRLPAVCASPQARSSGSWNWARSVVGLATLVVLVYLLFSGPFTGLTAEGLLELVDGAGIWSPAVYLLVFATLQPFGLSAHVLVPLAGVLWEAPQAVGLAWLGAMGSTATAFWFARFVGRAWVQSRLPAWLRAYDERLARHGFRTVLILRLLFYTFAPVELMFGVSRVRFRHVMAGSALGLLPVLVLEVLVGMGFLAWLQG